MAIELGCPTFAVFVDGAAILSRGSNDGFGCCVLILSSCFGSDGPAGALSVAPEFMKLNPEDDGAAVSGGD